MISQREFSFYDFSFNFKVWLKIGGEKKKKKVI